MKKTYKIDVDCANCANLMEQAAKKTAGVADATVNFMALKMTVEFEEGADEKRVMKDVFKAYLRFSYREHEVLKGLTLTATDGEMISLLGRNGAGKTTLLRLIPGFLKAPSDSSDRIEQVLSLLF